MKDNIHIEFEMEQKMCTSCRKSSNEYYELKVQIRFIYFEDNENIINEVKDLFYKNFDTFNKQEENENGLDFYFKYKGEKTKVSRLLNKRYLIEEKSSKTIVGRNFLESIDVWRHTLLVNIINLKVGDKILIKGEEFYIKAFNKKDLVLRAVKNGSKKVISYLLIKEYLQVLEHSKGKKMLFNDEKEDLE